MKIRATLAVAVLTSCFCAAVEVLPVYKPDELTRRSDLIVSGELISATELKVENVYKGEYRRGTVLEVPALVDFRPQQQKKDAGLNTVVLAPQALLFVDLRTARPSIVANGVFRLGGNGEDCGIFGYYQRQIRERYELRSELSYRDFGNIVEEITEAKKTIRAVQREKFTGIALAKHGDSWRQALTELGNVTRFGDGDVLREVLALKVDQAWQRTFLYTFVQEVRDPDAWPMLRSLYDATHEGGILVALGRLRHADSMTYLETIGRSGETPEQKLHGIVGLQQAYLSMEEAGFETSAREIKKRFFKLVDERSVPDLLTSHPRLLAEIGDSGAVQRLEKALLQSLGTGSSVEQEIDRALRDCRAKLARATRPFQTLTPTALMLQLGQHNYLLNYTRRDVSRLFGIPDNSDTFFDPDLPPPSEWGYQNDRGARLQISFQEGLVVRVASE